MDVFEFGDGAGRSCYAGITRGKHGDDKSGLPAIQSVLDGHAISGFEFGSSGLPQCVRLLRYSTRMK